MINQKQTSQSYRAVEGLAEGNEHPKLLTRASAVDVKRTRDGPNAYID